MAVRPPFLARPNFQQAHLPPPSTPRLPELFLLFLSNLSSRLFLPSASGKLPASFTPSPLSSYFLFTHIIQQMLLRFATHSAPHPRLLSFLPAAQSTYANNRAPSAPATASTSSFHIECCRSPTFCCSLQALPRLLHALPVLQHYPAPHPRILSARPTCTNSRSPSAPATAYTSSFHIKQLSSPCLPVLATGVTDRFTHYPSHSLPTMMMVASNCL